MTTRFRIIILSILLAALSAGAQITPQSAFTTAPTAAYPFIDRSMRLDMIDYHTDGIDKTMVNSLGDSCRILPSSDAMLVVQSAPGLTHTFVPLQGKSNPVIMVIATADTPSPDSSILFYTHDWKPLPTSRFISLPGLGDWFRSLTKEQKATVAEYVPFLTVKAQYDPATATITLSPTPGDYIDPDRIDEITSLLLPSITYKWNCKRFSK